MEVPIGGGGHEEGHGAERVPHIAQVRQSGGLQDVVHHGRQVVHCHVVDAVGDYYHTRKYKNYTNFSSNYFRTNVFDILHTLQNISNIVFHWSC